MVSDLQKSSGFGSLSNNHLNDLKVNFKVGLGSVHDQRWIRSQSVHTAVLIEV